MTSQREYSPLTWPRGNQRQPRATKAAALMEAAADWALKRYEAGLAGRSDAVEGNKMKVEPSPSGQEVPRNFGNNQSRNAWDAWRGVEKK